MLAKTWLENARDVVDRIEGTQLNNIRGAAEIMADSIAVERWVHTFGCGHATLPVEEMYPRIGGFVGFHPMIELPLTHFTHITGEMGIHQFLFLERAEGFGREVMKSYDFDPRGRDHRLYGRRLDDHNHGGGALGRARRQAVHPSVAQHSRRHDGA